jgi:hypothetical protein
MLNKKNIIYISLVIILLFIICQKNTYIEKYTTDYIHNNKIITVPIYKYIQPWWNSTRHTRNMSYDIRGDIGLYVMLPLL